MDGKEASSPRSDQEVEYTSEGEMELNIQGTEEEQAKLLNVWNFLCEFKFDKEGNKYLFIMRVMNICRFATGDVMDNRDAQVALFEYIKFLFLKAHHLLHGKDPDRLVPSGKMDLVWREQILYTEKYLELCNGIKKHLGLPEDNVIFHREYPRKIEASDYAERYRETMAEYRSMFGNAPTDWWPENAENENTMDNFYNSVMWSVGAFHEAGKYDEDPNLSELFTPRPLRLTEAGKTAVSKVPCRKLTGQQFAEMIDAVNFPEDLVVLYQKETRLPMEKVLNYFHEYKKYLWMSYFRPEVSVPSTPVDQLWHMHVTSTVNYDVETKKLFGHFLHHAPGGGTKEEKEGFATATASFKINLADFFEDGLDEDAWPSQEIKDDKHQSLFGWRARHPTSTA